jgi:excisionase family DNA binding protein
MYLDSYGDILTASEVAELLIIGKNTVYSLIRNGYLKGFRIGRTYKVPKSEVMNFVVSSIEKNYKN